MAYLNTKHTTVSKPIGINGQPTDARSYLYDDALFKYRPFISTTEVLNYLPTANNRVGQFPIFINSTGTLNGDGTITGGTVIEYWFKNGILDSNLIAKTVIDATTSVKGVVKLAGDLGGTADVPTVPALTNKADIASTLAGYGIIDAYPLSGNPSGFLTAFVESDPTVPAYAKTLASFTNIKTSTDTYYQPLENQRLSTSNTATFTGVFINGQNAVTTTSGNLPSYIHITGSAINQLQSFSLWSVTNTSSGVNNYQFSGAASANSSSNAYNYTLPTKSGTLALLSDITGVLAHDDITAQTASTTILVYNVIATGVYEIGTYLTVTAISSSTDGTTVTYTDENNNTITKPLIVNVFATGQYTNESLIRAKAGTTVTVSTSIVGGTVTYGAGAYIELKY